MTSFTGLLADARPSFSSRPFVYRQGEPEPWKDRACERDDLRDDAFLNSQHIESQRSPRGIAWTQHVVDRRRGDIVETARVERGEPCLGAWHAGGTTAALRGARFPSVLLQPLGHLSVFRINDLRTVWI